MKCLCPVGALLSPLTHLEFCFCALCFWIDRYTTGLGLPLSRALAKAGNGWLGLDDTCVSSSSTSSSGLSSSGSSAPAGGKGLPRRAPGYGVGEESHAVHIVTHYWCVLEATDSVSSRAHEIESTLPIGGSLRGCVQ